MNIQFNRNEESIFQNEESIFQNEESVFQTKNRFFKRRIGFSNEESILGDTKTKLQHESTNQNAGITKLQHEITKLQHESTNQNAGNQSIFHQSKATFQPTS
jgi:hypothetical protein